MSTQVTASLIKELRERTGIGMGKCKEALEESKGDMELAISNLRKAGMASAVKKEGRVTNEGLIATAEHNSTIALVEVNAETDFVAKNDRFKQFIDSIAAEVAETKPASLEAFLQQKYSKDSALTVDQYRATFVQTIGENIQIRRIVTFTKAPNKSIGTYSHQGGKIITLVEITGSNKDEALAKHIAMHVAAAAPEYLSPETVPAEALEHEKEIARSQMKGKPENMIEKIVEGKMKAFYDTSCLVCQKDIRDDSLTIADLVNKHAKEQGTTLSVTHFERWGVGQ
ncbi:MAG: elongation factor Ts [Parachlamydiaceae bacterium]|nr:elongation factor Ts [Parachlamydiaceae bacterium]